MYVSLTDSDPSSLTSADSVETEEEEETGEDFLPPPHPLPSGCTSRARGLDRPLSYRRLLPSEAGSEGRWYGGALAGFAMDDSVVGWLVDSSNE